MQAKHELTRILITEISLVDKAANDRVFLYKRAPQAPARATTPPPVDGDAATALQALSHALRAVHHYLNDERGTMNDER